MKNTNLSRILILLIAFVTFSISANSQPDCPPNTDPSEWDSHHIDASIPYFGNIGSVDYVSREVGEGDIEVVIDWTTLSNKIVGISDKGIMELVENAIILAFANCSQYPPGWSSERQVSIVYKSICYATVRCYLIVDLEREVECCDDPSVDPEIYEENGIKYRQVTKNVECGYKCCRRVYTLNCTWDDVYHRWNSWVSPTFTKETYPGSSCNGTSSFIDCKTNEPIPCEGGCD